MAGDFEKPDKVHTLFPDEIREKLWPLFRNASTMGSPVRTLYFFAGMDFASMTPCRLDMSPPTADGIVRRSSSSPKSCRRCTASQERNALFTSLFPDEIREKLWPLPVGELFSVGGASEQKLKRLGIMTIGDLAQADLGTLQATLKKHGEAIWNSTCAGFP